MGSSPAELEGSGGGLVVEPPAANPQQTALEGRASGQAEGETERAGHSAQPSLRLGKPQFFSSASPRPLPGLPGRKEGWESRGFTEGPGGMGFLYYHQVSIPWPSTGQPSGLILQQIQSRQCSLVLRNEQNGTEKEK